MGPAAVRIVGSREQDSRAPRVRPGKSCAAVVPDSCYANSGMKRNEPINSIMTDAPTTVNVTHKLSEIRRLMSEQRIHHVPVVSGRKLLGLISATDMVRLSFSAYGADERAVDAMLDHEFSIEGVMNTELVTLTHSSTVRDAAARLRDGRFHSLPVVDGDGNLVGIVTTTDLIGYLHDQY